MPEVAPPIYTGRFEPQRLSAPGRALAAALAAACLAVLLVAAWLEPDPAGIGTHEGLGLRPCSAVADWGVPCVTCGMTTAFSHAVRGNLLAGLYVQPMGAALALLAAMTFWGGLYEAVTARPAHRLFRYVPMRYYLGPLFALTLLAWGWKILIHLSGHDGWS